MASGCRALTGVQKATISVPKWPLTSSEWSDLLRASVSFSVKWEWVDTGSVE